MLRADVHRMLAIIPGVAPDGAAVPENDFFITVVTDIPELITQNRHRLRLYAPATIKMNGVLEAVQQSGIAGVVDGAVFFRIIVKGMRIADFHTEQPGEFGIEGDGRIIADVVSRNPLKGREGISSAQNVRFLTNHK